MLGYADGIRAGHVRGAPGAVAEDLAALLSQALLSFTLEYEEESDEPEEEPEEEQPRRRRRRSA